MELIGAKWTKTVFRGNALAKIDDKGRLKIPNTFRAEIADEYGREVFVTSLTGESVRVYPMPVWLEIERKLALAPSTHPARLKFLDRVAFYGQVAEFDDQGRVTIQSLLRDEALMTGEVTVLGKLNFLEVWNRDRFRSNMHSNPFTDADARDVSEFLK